MKKKYYLCTRFTKKKIDMRLQRMLFQNPWFVPGYDDEPEVFSHVCAVNEIQAGGEYTLCGCAIPDSNLDIEGWEADGDEFNGKLKDVTCPNCRRFIKYVKSLK